MAVFGFIARYGKILSATNPFDNILKENQKNYLHFIPALLKKTWDPGGIGFLRMPCDMTPMPISEKQKGVSRPCSPDVIFIDFRFDPLSGSGVKDLIGENK